MIEREIGIWSFWGEGVGTLDWRVSKGDAGGERKESDPREMALVLP